jgi:SulP family sulfate permease
VAGILIKIALDTIDWRYLKRVRTAPRSGVVLMFTVMILTVVFNLVVAAAVGFVLASLMFVKRMADLQLESVHAVDNPSGEPGLGAEEREMIERLKDRAMLIRFSGPISFGAANRLHRRISGYQNYDCVMLDLTDVPEVDSSATLALENIIVNSIKLDHVVILIGLTTPVARTFARLGILDLIREVERYPSREEALRYAVGLLALETEESTTD